MLPWMLKQKANESRAVGGPPVVLKESPVRRRERWIESDILAFPDGEHDYFERKSGRLFGDNPASEKDEIRKTISKALSAFSNTEGGHLLLGVANDGTLDGVPGLIGSTSTRDWIEQQIPHLIEPTIHEFRIHNVEKSVASTIADGREVIVIDVEGSFELRQAIDCVYYYRAGGRSIPAKHSYLEQRRQRMRPVLDFELTEIRPINAYSCPGGAFLETDFVFVLKNPGQLAANKWSLQITGAEVATGRKPDYFFSRSSYPIKKGRSSGIRIDDTILPGRLMQETIDVGFLLHPGEDMGVQLKVLIDEMKVDCHLALEEGPGIEKSFRVAPVADPSMLATYIVSMLSP